MNHPRRAGSSLIVLSIFLIAGCQTTQVVTPHPIASTWEGGAADSESVGGVANDRSLIDPHVVVPLDPSSTSAAPLSYTFVEVGAMKYNIDSLDSFGNVDTDVDKYYGRASLGLGLVHIFAGYENQRLDLQNTSSDLFRLGGGAHIELTDRVHAVGEAAWLYEDVSSDLAGFGGSNSGYELKAGMRWMAVDWEAGGLELDGNLVWVNLKDSLASNDEALGWEGGLRIHLFEMFSAGVMYTRVESDDQIAVSARLSF